MPFFALTSSTWDGLSDGVAILIITALLLLGLFLGYALRGLVGRWQAESIEKKMRLREEEAEAEIKARLKEADISARATVVKAREEFEASTKKRRVELQAVEDRQTQREANLDRKAAALDERWGVFYGERGGELLRRLHAKLRQAFLGVSVRRGRSGSVYPPDVLDRIETDLAAAAAFFEREGDDLRRRRFRLMAMPLEFELDRQRGIHAGTVKEPERLRYVAGDE